MDGNDNFSSGGSHNNFNGYQNQPGLDQDKPTINYNTNYNTNHNSVKGGLKGCLVSIITAIATPIIVIISGLFIIGMLFGSTDEHYSSGPYVEILYFDGAIEEGANVNSYGISYGYNHNWTLNEIHRLKEDTLNKGIVMYINSPGGGVYESDEVYLALKDYKESTGRPVYAYMAQSATSGALYVSMAADEIYANRMTTTGSIGVIMSTYDLSGLYEKLGIKTVKIVSGRNKGMGGGDSFTDEQLQILQQIVDESYNVFVGIIAEERGIDLDRVIEISDGRLYTATQAVDLGLIDGIKTYDELMNYLFKKRAFKGCEFISNYYQTDSLISRIFAGVEEFSKESKSETESLLELLNDAENNQNKLMWE